MCLCIGREAQIKTAGAGPMPNKLLNAPEATSPRRLQVQAAGTNVCLLLLHWLPLAVCRCTPAGPMLVSCSCIGFLSLFADAHRPDQCLFIAPALASSCCLQVQTGWTYACLLLLQLNNHPCCRCKPEGPMLVYCSCISFLSLIADASRRDLYLFTAPALASFRCLQVQAARTYACLLLLHRLPFADCRCKPAVPTLVSCPCI